MSVDRRTDAESSAETEQEPVEIKVFRYDPDVPEKAEPHYDRFEVPRARGMSVLDALIHARDEIDPTLTFRHSCRQAICGSDAMMINGRHRLACKTQISDLSEPIQIEPLPHQNVEKDLVVDMERFYEQMDAVDPFFDPDDEPTDPLTEQRQSPANHEHIKMSTRCIWCGSCMSSCNIAAGDNQYIGPAAINMAYRFLRDEREGEERAQERVEKIAEDHGVWRCQTQFSCTEVCPKEIPLTEHIQSLKREAHKRNLSL